MTSNQQDNLKRWIAALRSGIYVQGQGTLRDISHGQERFCCLGVACEVLGFPRNEGFTYLLPDTTEAENDIPGTTFHNMFGLPRGEQSTLMIYNDSLKLSFDKIATYLEDKFLEDVV